MNSAPRVGRRRGDIPLIGLLALVGWLSILSLAEAAPPTTFVWDRNAEADLDHYNVFTCSGSATCVPSTNIGTVPQPAVGTKPTFAIPANSSGRAAVTAVDVTGNESGLSNILPFDRQSPTAPTGLLGQ